MGVGNQCFDVAATYLKKIYENPQSLAVRAGIQSCPMYIAAVRDREPFLLQFRLRDRALIDKEKQEIIHRVLGSLVPSMKLLGECDIDGTPYLAYEQSIIPGEAFSNIWAHGELSKLPKAAEGIARLLARCIIPGTSAGIDRHWYEKAMTVLEQACNTKDPLLTPYIRDFVEVRDAVEAGGLDGLPLAVTNGDVSALNILAKEDGGIGGLVEWEMMHYDERPLGTDLSAIHWIRSRDRGDRFEDIESTNEIEDRFWRAFFRSIPGDVASNRKALEIAMKLGIVLQNVHEGVSNFPMGVPTLRIQFDYEIPLLPLEQAGSS